MIKYLKLSALITIVLACNSYSLSSIRCTSAQNCNRSKLSPACKTTSEPLNLSVAKECVQFYFECGQYDKDMESIVDTAITCLTKIKSSHNNAAIFWDIDDTLLSYYCKQKSIFFGYIPELWHTWIMRGDAKAIPQAKRLFDHARNSNLKILYSQDANQMNIVLLNKIFTMKALYLISLS